MWKSKIPPTVSGDWLVIPISSPFSIIVVIWIYTCLASVSLSSRHSIPNWLWLTSPSPLGKGLVSLSVKILVDHTTQANQLDVLLWILSCVAWYCKCVEGNDCPVVSAVYSLKLLWSLRVSSFSFFNLNYLGCFVCVAYTQHPLTGSLGVSSQIGTFICVLMTFFIHPVLGAGGHSKKRKTGLPAPWVPSVQ